MKPVHTPAEIQEFERINASMSSEQLESMIDFRYRLPDHNLVMPEIIATEAERNEMRARYDSVENELKKFGIDFKIKNFTEFEDGLQQLNKLKFEENYI